MKPSKNLISICAMALFVTIASTGCATYSGQSASGRQVAPTDFRVRVGVYQRNGLPIARKVEDNLREAGYKAYMRRINSKVQGLYVGRNLSKSDADALKRRLDRFLDTETLVVSM